METTGHVKTALVATKDLRTLNAATLKANPGALPTLRMCTAPPLAVDRLIGLADASKNLVGRMEKGKLPTKMKAADLDAELTKLCKSIGPSGSERLLAAHRSFAGSWVSALEFSIGVFDTPMLFEQATEFERAKVDVPDTVIDLLK